MMKTLSFAAIALTVMSCGSIGDPELARGAGVESLPDSPNAWVSSQGGEGKIAIGWIEKLSDPVLADLVAEAIANNRDLRAAAGSVQAARNIARQAGAALVPAVDVTATAARAGIVDIPSADSYSAGLQLAWEVDVWGRVRATRNSAALRAYSAEADFLFAQYSIAAAVAQTYFLTIESGLQLEVARKSFDALIQTDRIVRAQRDIGVASGLDVALSRRDLANARDSVLAAEAAQRLAIRALEVLLGRYPSSALVPAASLPATPAPPPPDAPSSLLNRRPDIIAAELAVAAADNNVESTQAARLPTISLTSTIGGSSAELSDVLNPENVAWQFASNLVGPLFDGGLRRARVSEARGSREQALGTYAQTVLDAFQEVESSLDQNVVLREREVALAEAAVEANRAFSLARIRYEEGETDLLDVLTIQSTAFAADSALVSVRRALLDEWITLNLALGGDWQSVELP